MRALAHIHGLQRTGEIIACILTGAWHTLHGPPSSEINTLTNTKQADRKTSGTHVFLAVRSHCFFPPPVSESRAVYFRAIQVHSCIIPLHTRPPVEKYINERTFFVLYERFRQVFIGLVHQNIYVSFIYVNYAATE